MRVLFPCLCRSYCCFAFPSPPFSFFFFLQALRKHTRQFFSSQKPQYSNIQTLFSPYGSTELHIAPAKSRKAKMTQCYYPDGTEAPDTPCNSTAEQSACCGSSAYCLANGLCLGDGGTSRGSCTDESWEDDSCPQYCRDSTETAPHILLLLSLNKG